MGRNARWNPVPGADVDEQAYPGDFAIFARYHTALKKIADCYPLPESLRSPADLPSD